MVNVVQQGLSILVSIMYGKMLIYTKQQVITMDWKDIIMFII